jgi:two-component system LytT family response regulator
MTNITAIIVDDAPQARELLSLMIAELAPNVTIIGEAENLQQAVALIRTVKPELVFLDIEMSGKSGLQIFEELPKNELHFDIIFTTAYNQYAIQAFRLSAIDYLLKPIKENELIDAIEKVSELKKRNLDASRFESLSKNFEIWSDKTICLPMNYGYDYVPVNNIMYIEADGAYAHLFLNDGKKKTCAKNLKYFEDALQHIPDFIRVSRFVVINLAYLAAFNKANRGIIILKNNTEISLSHTYRAAFLERVSPTHND